MVTVAPRGSCARFSTVAASPCCSNEIGSLSEGGCFISPVMGLYNMFMFRSGEKNSTHFLA
jgi:hypothetical protein